MLIPTRPFQSSNFRRRAFVRKNEELKKRVFWGGRLFKLLFKLYFPILFFFNSWSLEVTRGHSWSLVCNFSQDRVFQFVKSLCKHGG